MKQILCMGSVNLDHTYRLDHIVTPGETTTCTAYACNWGGKGLNQGIALARAGANAHLAARVSQDDLPRLQALCAPDGLDTALVQGTDTVTGHALIQVDAGGQNSIVIYGGANTSWSEADIAQCLSPFGPGDFLLLQNELNDTPTMMRMAKAKGMTLVLNPSPIAPEMAQWPMELVDLLILNEVEGAALSGESQSQPMLKALAAKYPATHILLTLGEEGSCYLAGETYLEQSAISVTAVDTTAAGDTFTGYFLASYMEENGSIPLAMKRAAHAAAMAVTREGAVQSIPHHSQLTHIL